MNTTESPTNDPNSDDPQPTGLQRLPDGRLEIRWTDGVAMSYRSQQLRDACPCATCREKRRANDPDTTTQPSRGLPVLNAAETQPIQIQSMQPVGRYAYNITFSDGHNSGIFPFSLLRKMGKESVSNA